MKTVWNVIREATNSTSLKSVTMTEFNEQCIEALPTPITYNVDYVADTKNILKKEYSLKILNINIRSIGKHFDELILFLHDIHFEFDVIILSCLHPGRLKPFLGLVTTRLKRQKTFL